MSHNSTPSQQGANQYEQVVNIHEDQSYTAAIPLGSQQQNDNRIRLFNSSQQTDSFPTHDDIPPPSPSIYPMRRASFLFPSFHVRQS